MIFQNLLFLIIINASVLTIDFDPANVKMYQNDKSGKRITVRSVSWNEFKNKIDKRHRSKGFWYAVARVWPLAMQAIVLPSQPPTMEP